MIQAHQEHPQHPNRRSTDPGNPHFQLRLPEPLLTLPQACQLLCLSATTLYRLVERRQIPFLKIGGGLRFERMGLAAWLEGQRKEALGWQVSPLTAKIESLHKTTGGK